MYKVKVFLTVLLAAAALAGCATNEARDNGDNGVENTGYQNIGTRDDGLIDQRNDNNGIMNNDNNADMNNGNNERRMDVAEQASDRVAAMKEIDRAYTVTTENNAYVAVVLADDPKGEISDKLKNRISDKVKQTDNDIDNVYVSQNPDFTDRMADYTDRIEQGDPIEGFFDEFTEMTRRVFPNAR
ncbi:YhcN/YlaJ family sporulation lipoprotein [Bacillus marinisedimentorum]|uniref:YhcN/YlaJ family sporulation lipoprotein n=1 Tax=Bacillus marinisedimentorum TaxID=1821260 RepID=UPI000872C012|nr:YhcN/YlaJ family sporulation lipoprotein [Bacillus marinisedimentorum]